MFHIFSLRCGRLQKCRNMHDEWLHLKKRVDSIRDLHRALVLPSQPVTQAADEPTKQKETSTKNGDTLGKFKTLLC